MRKNYSRKSVQKRSGSKTALLTVGVIALLVVLFFLSFWVTSLILKANHEPVLPQHGVADASPTPKPTYEELEKMVIEKDKEIKTLEEELARYRGNSFQTEEPRATSQPLVTQAPTEAPAVATKAPTQAPTVAPTKAPTPAPTKAPTPAPTVEPTVAPTKAPTIKPVAPGAAEMPSAE